MTAVARAIGLVERTALPDRVTRAGIHALCARTRRRLAGNAGAERAFAATMMHYPVATHTDDANAQHYELPAAFFGHVLGPARKYSCCYYEDGATSLAEAEQHALAISAERAGLADGQRILELGCGWGSLSLFMARMFPGARITAVSNSNSQRRHIESAAIAGGLTNLRVLTCDMNDFATEERFDRIVSVEMFEHMSNWRTLLERAHGWLERDGAMFVHIFTHRAHSYRFDHANRADWIAQHFFTGGIMPAHGLMAEFGDLFTIDDQWRWNGRNYARTAEDWLARYDRAIDRIRPILAEVYGADARLWERRWRLFFLATAGLFGHATGEEWGVSHYRLRPR